MFNDYYYERIENNRYARIHGAKSRHRYNIKRFITMISIFITILLFTIISIKHFTYADDTNVNVRKQYKSVMIYCGDSVDSMTDDYVRLGFSSKDALIKELCSINGISSDSNLIAGNFLIIPYYENIY